LLALLLSAVRHLAIVLHEHTILPPATVNTNDIDEKIGHTAHAGPLHAADNATIFDLLNITCFQWPLATFSTTISNHKIWLSYLVSTQTIF
jgi:hypothetical protein